MKKYSIKVLLCAAAVALCACSKSGDIKNPGPGADDVRIVNLTAVSPQTRTHFGDKDGNAYPVMWDADDQIRVSINSQDTGSGNKYKDSHETVVAEGGKTASFSVKLLNTKAPDRYVYYAYTPIDHAYEEDNSVHSGGFYGNPDDRVRLWIPTVQTPTATTVDRFAQVLFGESADCGSYDVNPTLRFRHFTAYGKLSLTNLALDAGDAVKTVTLTASANNLTGGYVHNPVTGETIDESSTHSRELQIVTSAAEGLWFGCFAGVDGTNDLSDTSLTVKVVTENLVTFTRVVDLTGKALKFEAGKVAAFSVDMASADKVTPVEDKKLEAYVDFGGKTSGTPWYDYTAPNTQLKLNDADDFETAVLLEASANFSAWGGATAEPNKTIVSNGIEWPLSVWRDALMISGTKNEGNVGPATVKLSGLDKDKTYKVVLLSVRYNGSTNARETQFTVVGAKASGTTKIKSGIKIGSDGYQSWDVIPFDNFTAVYTGIVPDAEGCISIEVVGIDTKMAAEGHLNGMYIAEE